jgi:PucR C-terminal helix-turn-helix domain/GGDEF-like domain
LSAIDSPLSPKADFPPTVIVRAGELPVIVRRDTIRGGWLVTAITTERPTRSRVDGCATVLLSMSMASLDIDAQVIEIGSAVGRRLDEIAQRVASSVRASVEFYKDTEVVTFDELLSSSSGNIRFLFEGLHDGATFDTSPAVATGTSRAAAGVPLPAVMDAFRVATHHLWDAMVEVADADARVGRDALLRATALLWHAQDAYTDAMSAAYRRQAVQQTVDDEAERSALTEALLQARISDDRTLWEVAQLLRLPQRGPFVVIAAKCPAIGKQALPGIAAMLRSIDVFSAWRLLPDLQTGIAHVPSGTERGALLELLGRVATTAVGVSPEFDNLGDTAQALRYARIAVNARGRGPGAVTVFEDSVIGVAAVSAPEVAAKVADLVLGGFDQMAPEERGVLFDTFRTWVDNDGSIPNAASQLFCHPNTVRYRLHRIEQRTGRSLSVPRELAELCLAFEIYQDSW